MPPSTLESDAHGLDGPSPEARRAAGSAAEFGHWQIDAGGREVTWSAGIAAIFGAPMPPGDVVDLDAHLSFYHPDDRPAIRRRIAATLGGSDPAIRDGYKCQARVLRADGSQRLVMVRAAPLRDEAGAVTALRGVIIDISEHAHMQESLREAGELLLATLENMDQGLILYGPDMRVRLHNRRALELLDLPESVLHVGSPYSAINAFQVARGEFQSSPTRLVTALEHADLASLPDVYERQRPDGSSLEVRVVRLADGGYLRTYTDTTQRKEAERQVAHMAVHDALTGLPNRTLFRDRLDREMITAQRRGSTFAVLACDLDRFKAVNDTHGHPAGDALLCAVAKRLRTVLREGDTVARLGGDEFAILLGQIDGPQSAGAIARRVIEAVNQPVDLDGSVACVGVSLGIAIGPQDGGDADTLFRNADIALYRAKAGERNTYSFYEPGMDAAVAERNGLERELRGAIERGALSLNYQPILGAPDGGAVGFEALLRWTAPERGSIPPVTFIPIAEETGLIVPIGAWVLREACREAAGWAGDLSVAVNVSPVQFQRPGLEQAVLGALAASGLPPHRLELEITESVLMRDSEAAIACLHRLRAMGVRIALDDFGTGYSSLSYLRRFPFDKIKIDRSFICDLDNADTAAIVRAIVGIGERLGATITAEGVETARQLEQVRREGCTETQGYLHSRPLAALDARRFVDPGPAVTRVA